MYLFCGIISNYETRYKFYLYRKRQVKYTGVNCITRSLVMILKSNVLIAIDDVVMVVVDAGFEIAFYRKVDSPSSNPLTPVDLIEITPDADQSTLMVQIILTLLEFSTPIISIYIKLYFLYS